MTITDFLIGEWAYITKPNTKRVPMRVKLEHYSEDGLVAEPIPVTHTILVHSGFLPLKKPDDICAFIYKVDTNDNKGIAIHRTFKSDGTADGEVWCLCVSSEQGIIDINVRYAHEMQRAFNLCGVVKDVCVPPDNIVYAPYVLQAVTPAIGGISSKFAQKKVNTKFYKTMDNELKSKYKIGDFFTRKNTRDYPVMKIVEIVYNSVEPVYQLEPVKGIGNSETFGEEALDELYVLVKK
jgi:hypothetical protein